MTDAIIQIAKQAPHSRTKQEWLAEIEKRAEAFRQRGESHEQAFAKFITTDSEGIALFAAHQRAPGPVSAGRTGSVPVRKNGDGEGLTNNSEVDSLARQLRQKKPELTHAQAVTEVLATKEGTAAYQRDRTATLRKSALAMHGV